MAKLAKRENLPPTIEPAVAEVPPLPPQPTPEVISSPQPAASAAAVVDQPSPFEDMLKREYENAMQQQIKKGIQQISERFRRMLSQERRSTDVSHDALGKSSDDYERIIRTYYSGNAEALAGTTEDLYEMLYELKFTEMKPLDVIKQQYQITK